MADLAGRASPGRPPRTLLLGSLRGVLLNLAFCLLVAGGIFLSFGVPFWHAFVVSCCIGFSIQLLSTLGGWLARDRVPLPLLMLLTVPAGVMLGYLLGELLLTGGWSQAWVLERESLLLGALFGVLGASLFLLGTSVFSLRDSLRDAQMRQLEADKALAEAELKRLQAQIEPHFLFNTLANLHSLIRQDVDAAEQAVEQLSDLLRASLRRSRDGATTLADELEVVKSFLSLHALRMGTRLRWQIETDPALEQARLPPLLLQPLVENAVRHGIELRSEGGEITVRAREEDNMLWLEVEDDGVGISASGSGDGIGLQNIRERLAALYGHRARLEVLLPEAGGTRVRLVVPREQVQA